MKTNKQTQSVADSDRNNSDNPKPTEPSTQEPKLNLKETIEIFKEMKAEMAHFFSFDLALYHLQSLEAENANLQKAVESVRVILEEGICGCTINPYTDRLEECGGCEALKQLDATKEVK